MRIKDGDWVLFDYDVKSGRQVWLMEHADGTTTIRTDYPVDPLIDENTAMRNAVDPGWKGDWHKIASIPAGLVYGELEGAIAQQDDKYLSRWLNDSDNRAWRTKEGRV